MLRNDVDLRKDVGLRKCKDVDMPEYACMSSEIIRKRLCVCYA